MDKQKSKDQCHDCKDVVNGEDLALSCDLSLKWYHINCQSVGKVVYNFPVKKKVKYIGSVKKMWWTCYHHFKNYVHQAVQHIQEEVNQLKSSNSDILNRLSKLEDSDASQITKSDKYNNVKVSELEKKLNPLISQRELWIRSLLNYQSLWLKQMETMPQNKRDWYKEYWTNWS